MTTKKQTRLWKRVLLCLFLPCLSIAQTDEVEITFNTPPIQCIDDANNCTATVAYDFQVNADCPFGQLQIEAFLNIFNDGSLLPITNDLNGSFPNYSLGGSYPIGQHSFEVVVDDGCGNIQTAVLPFEVGDCDAGPPVCASGVVVELMLDYENGLEIGPQAYLSYHDVLAEPVMDCTPPVSYSINIEGEAIDPDQDSILLDCEREGIQAIELHVQDGLGHSGSCITYILVQNNTGNSCSEESFGIGGQIWTEDGLPIAGVPVSLSGQSGSVDTTDAMGAYHFYDPVAGFDYTFTPQWNADPLNGVSTFDLVLINQHILGIAPLDSPYKRIAADVNGSGHISTLDLIQIRRMILGMETEFDNVNSWRFVDAAYIFPDPDNPWSEPFPEVINVNDLTIFDGFNNDFIGIKVGDVNGSVDVD